MCAWQQKARGVGIQTRTSDWTLAGGAGNSADSYKPFKSVRVAPLSFFRDRGGRRIVLYRRWSNGSLRKQEPERPKEANGRIVERTTGRTRKGLDTSYGRNCRA